MSGSPPPETAHRGLDLLRARVTFRDRSLSEVLDLALRFIAVEGRSYAIAVLLGLVPAAAIAAIAGSLLGWAAGWAIALPLATMAEIPFTVLASRLVFQDRVRVRDVMRAAAHDAPRVLLVRAAAAALSALALTFFVVPGLWLGANFLFVSEVLLLERAPPAAAVGRAQRIASSMISDVLLGLLVLDLMPLLVVFAFDVAGRAVIGELLQFRPPPPLFRDGGSLLAILGLFAQVPYRATARFLLYLSVRTRVEGWDIQTRFAGIHARAVERSGAEAA